MVSIPKEKDEILTLLGYNPGTSVWRVSGHTGISASIVWRIIQEQLLYNRAITAGFKSISICRWYFRNSDENTHFRPNILLTD